MTLGLFCDLGRGSLGGLGVNLSSPRAILGSLRVILDALGAIKWPWGQFRCP